MELFKQPYSISKKRFLKSLFILPLGFAVSWLASTFNIMVEFLFIITGIVIITGFAYVSLAGERMLANQSLSLTLPLSRAEFARESLKNIFRVYGLALIPVWIWCIGTHFFFPGLDKFGLPVAMLVFSLTGAAMLSLWGGWVIVGAPVRAKQANEFDAINGALVFISLLFAGVLFFLAHGIDWSAIGALYLGGFILLNAILILIGIKNTISYVELKSDV